MQGKFTIEELTFLELYKTPQLEQTKTEISMMIPIIDDEEMIQLAKSVLSKLERMSEKEFQGINFMNTLKVDDLDNK